MGSVAPGMWDLPGPGIKPVAPGLAGGFLTAGPPRKSLPSECCRKHLSPEEFLAKEVSGLSNVLTQREQKRGLEGSAPNWQWPEADSGSRPAEM